MTTPNISLERLTVADALLAEGVTDMLYSHAAYALAQRGTVLARKAFGDATLDTVFDLASLTKPVATATAIMQLVEQGKLHLLQSVGRFFEDEFGPLPHLSDVEVRHLLTHTSGLPPIPRWPKPDPKPTRAEMLRSTLTTPLLRSSGIGYTYSDTGYIVLGEIVARTGGQPLDVHFREHVAKPLGLQNTGFLPSPTLGTRLAPTSKASAPGMVHDPRAADLGGVSGHAGLFGTAEEMLTYTEAIRSGGAPLISYPSAARMARSQIEPAVGGQSYGWFCAGNGYLPQGDLFSDRAYGHSGFTGTALLIDPTYDLSLVLLTNRVVNEEEDGSRFLRLRRLWLNAIAASIF